MMLVRGWWWLGLGAGMVVACGGNDPLGQIEPQSDGGGPTWPPDGGQAALDAGSESLDDRAGSRLEPRYYEVRGADGSLTRELNDWFDRELGANCRTATASDGTLRCVPLAESPAPAFSDATCTDPVLVVERGPCALARPLLPYVIVPAASADSCAASELAAYPHDAPLPLDTYYVQQGAACEPIDVRPGTAVFDRDALQAVLPAQLVAMQQSEVVLGSGARLQHVAVRTVGADGSSAVSGDQVLDTTRGEYCNAAPLGDAGSSCAPYAASKSVVGYASDSCAAGTELLGGVVLPYACYQPDPRRPYGKYLQNAQAGACARVDLYETPTTAAYDGPLFTGAAGACVAGTVDARTRAWPAASYGAPLAPSTFVAVEAAYEPAAESPSAHSGTSLRAVRQVSRYADGLVVSAKAQLAGADGQLCFAQQLEDGNEYCVHGATNVTPSPARFADAACTDPVLRVPYLQSGCEVSQDAAYLLEQDYAVDACKPQHSYRVKSAPISTPLFEQDDMGTCVPSAPLVNERAYRKSELEPFDPATWVRVVRTERAP